MSNFISIVIIGLLIYGGSKFSRYWKSVKAKQEQADKGGTAESGGTLSGLPPNLETSLQSAKTQGALAFKAWMKQYRGYIQDPRLAQIELDYVVMIATTDQAEAKRVFTSVRSRVQPGTPQYDRVKKLEKTYQ